MTNVTIHGMRSPVPRGGQLTILDHSGIEKSLPWSELLANARNAAGWFAAQDIGPGASVMLAAKTSYASILAIVSAFIAGTAVSVSAVPVRPRHSGVLRNRVQRLRDEIEPALLLGDADQLELLDLDEDPTAVNLTDWISSLCRGAYMESDPPLVDENDAVVLQATSGTTGLPKVARVTDRNLRVNHAAIASALEVDPSTDRFLSWLPLSHDMGLIGLMGTALVTGTDLVVADPALFAAQPGDWMRWCSEFRATITGGPSFAFGIAASMMRTRPPGNLSSLRVVLNGAELVNVGICEEFCTVGEQFGLKRESHLPVYGLAEATLAVAFPSLGRGVQEDSVGIHELEQYEAVPCEASSAGSYKTFAIVGHPLPGVDVRIVKGRGATADHREVGRIEVRGASVIPGYLGEPPLSDSWLDTGDLGYFVEDQLVVCGRSKDLIVIAGRNIFPEEIEAILATTAGVWRSNVAAFGLRRDHRENVIVMAEAENPADTQLQQQLAQLAGGYLDVRIHDVVLLSPGSIPKTPSGKISRSGCSDLYLSLMKS